MIDTTLKYQAGPEEIKNEQPTGFVLEGLELDRHYKQYISGALFAMPGYCTPETMHACNIFKRLLIVALKCLSNPLTSILGLINKQKYLDRFNDVAWKAMKGAIRKDENLLPIARGVRDFTCAFLGELGFTFTSTSQFSEMFSMVFEADNAYRYRLQDLFQCTDEYLLLNNPRREIKKLIRLLVERDDHLVSKKLLMFANLLSWALIIPKYRRAFTRSVPHLILRQTKPEHYWAMIREDYKYEGLTRAERAEKYPFYHYPNKTSI